MMTDAEIPAHVLTRAADGFRTTLASQIIRLGCKAASVIVVARLVSPAAHGVFALAATIMTVLMVFRDLGLGTSALQVRDLSREQETTLWWAHLGLSGVLAALMVGLAPLAAAFFAEPQIKPLLGTMSVAVIAIGGNNWPRVWLARQLRFRDLNQIETTGAIVGTVAMIAGAALGAQAYAFVMFLVVSEFAMWVAGWRIADARPRGGPHWSSIAPFWRNGLHLTGSNLLTYFHQQIDVLVMGRWFGARAVGLYTRPNQLLSLANIHAAVPLTNVLSASLVRLPSDARYFVDHVRATTNLVAHLTLPLAAFCIALPDEIVRLVLGPAWPDAAPLLRWLAVSAAATYLSNLVTPVCVATHRTHRLTAMAAGSLLAISAGLWFGRGNGPVGLATGVAVANVTLLIPRFWWCARGTPLQLGDFMQALCGPLVLALALGLSAAMGRELSGSAPWFARLGVGVVGGAVAGGLLVALWPRLRRELAEAWTHRPQRSPAASLCR